MLILQNSNIVNYLSLLILIENHKIPFALFKYRMFSNL